ncbi:TPA: LLM class flavin-dependent oxidoreductase [Candidatus Spyradomonas excrementavium]|nr:LLM class flavin-dependent oxidoreductase [Candidatus Spyradomonas excrementavium]
MDKKSIINEIKILAMERDLTLTQVASLLSEKLNKKYSLNNLSQKLRKETIPYREIKLIAEILDYDIRFIDKRTRY